MKKIIFSIAIVILCAGSASAQQIPFKGKFNLGVDLLVNTVDSGLPVFSAEGIGYAEVSEYLHLGAGAGFTIYGVEPPSIIPMFFHSQLILPCEKVSPYMACNVGYGWCIEGAEEGGFYLAPSAGVLIRLSDGLRLSLGVGLSTQKMMVDGIKYANNLLSIRAGLVF